MAEKKATKKFGQKRDFKSEKNKKTVAKDCASVL